MPKSKSTPEPTVPSYPSLTRLAEALSLRSLAKRTVEDYLRYLRKLGSWAQADPACLDEARVRQHLLHLKGERRYSASSMRCACAAITFFYRHVVGVEWRLFDLVRSPERQKLPLVLSRADVARLLAAVREIRFQVFLLLVYCCGLRLGEALRLEVTDIKADRKLLLVRLGKGGKDRYVPLPDMLVPILRRWWRTHKHPRLIFPALGSGWRDLTPGRAAQAKEHMSESTVQHCMKLVVATAGLPQNVTPHTLRHSYATHLLEDGVSLKQISQFLGHNSIETTVIYTHVTSVSEEKAFKAVNQLPPPIAPL